MTDDKRPPREWTLFHSGLSLQWDVRSERSALSYNGDSDEYVHVIEYAAYQALVDTNQKLVKERDLLKAEVVEWRLSDLNGHTNVKARKERDAYREENEKLKREIAELKGPPA